MKACYEQILHNDYRGIRTRHRMSMDARAAQFAPFAALTGYSDVIEDTQKKHLNLEEGTQESCELFPE